jgi:hypothetical protein
MRLAGLLTFPEDVVAAFDCSFDLAATSAMETVGSNGTTGRVTVKDVAEYAGVSLVTASNILNRPEVARNPQS